MRAQVWIDPEDGRLVDYLREYESRIIEMEMLVTSAGYARTDFAIVKIEASDFLLTCP